MNRPLVLTSRVFVGILPLAMLLMALTGCGRTDFLPFDFKIDETAAGSWIEMEGIRFDFDVPVVHKIIAVSSRTKSRSLGNARSMKTIELLEEHYFNVGGEWLKLEDGVLKIAEKRYGRVGEGDKVRVSAGGVVVNGLGRAAE